MAELGLSKGKCSTFQLSQQRSEKAQKERKLADAEAARKAEEHAS